MIIVTRPSIEGYRDQDIAMVNGFAIIRPKRNDIDRSHSSQGP
jgi:hypothetical protein